jgi:phosphoglycolate phosphatase-like HAD superfamily hydrolase
VIRLALFDVDGTLFLTDDPLVGEVLAEVLGVPNEIRRLDHAGRTIAWIARGLLGGADPPAGWCKQMEQRYLEVLGETPSWEGRAGAAEALTALREAEIGLALVTGLPEQIARVRLERVGLGAFFQPGLGAFGCDSEDREELVRIAIRRSEVEPGEALEIGDTPADITTAHAVGLRSIVFADGDAPHLAAADRIVRTMPELVEVLLAYN